MIGGHFGLAAGVKSQERATPLWALMLATAWLDIVFAPLLGAGIETIEDVPDTDGGYGNVIIHADYTHSLVGAAVLAAVFGLVAARYWGRRAGSVLGGVVFSHWLLDLVVHRSDMPLLPGNLGDLPRLGFGLWRLPAVSITVELILILAGTYLYWRAAAQLVQTDESSLRGRPSLIAGLMLVAGFAVVAVDALGF